MSSKILRCALHCKLFSGVETDMCLALLESIRYDVKTYHAGAIVAFKGDRYERLSIIVEGRLSAEMLDLKGRVLKIETLAAPSVIAGGILFATRNHLPVQLRAETDATLLSFSRQSVLSLCRGSSLILENLLRDAGDKITFLAEKIYLHRFTSIRQKIAGYFLDLSIRQNSTIIELPYTIEVTAELFGVSRPSLSRSLSELVDERMLAKSGRDWEILDPDMLENLIDE